MIENEFYLKKLTFSYLLSINLSMNDVFIIRFFFRKKYQEMNFKFFFFFLKIDYWWPWKSFCFFRITEKKNFKCQFVYDPFDCMRVCVCVFCRLNIPIKEKWQSFIHFFFSCSYSSLLFYFILKQNKKISIFYITIFHSFLCYH